MISISLYKHVSVITQVVLQHNAQRYALSCGTQLLDLGPVAALFTSFETRRAKTGYSVTSLVCTVLLCRCPVFGRRLWIFTNCTANYLKNFLLYDFTAMPI